MYSISGAKTKCRIRESGQVISDKEAAMRQGGLNIVQAITSLHPDYLIQENNIS
jgi:hypothetical protein